MKHAIEVGWRWDALVLFDPPNVPPADHPLYPTMEAFERRLVVGLAAGVVASRRSTNSPRNICNPGQPRAGFKVSTI
jgi:hypothetical protein